MRAFPGRPFGPPIGGGAPLGPLAAEMFKRADANKDGKVSLDEVPSERRELFKRLLDRADKDGDKALSVEEARRLAAAVMMRVRGASARWAHHAPGVSPRYAAARHRAVAERIKAAQAHKAQAHKAQAHKAQAQKKAGKATKAIKAPQKAAKTGPVVKKTAGKKAGGPKKAGPVAKTPAPPKMPWAKPPGPPKPKL
jgi:hypothetical protein